MAKVVEEFPEEPEDLAGEKRLDCEVIRNLYFVSDLSGLTEVDLTGKNLTAPTNEEKEELISCLCSVETLLAGGNKFNLSEFGGFLFLETLELQANSIKRLSTIASSNDFQALTRLDLSANFLDNDCLAELAKLPVLADLNLALNKLTKWDFSDSSAFGTLSRLSLRGNRLSGPDFVELARLPALTELNVSENRISDIPTLEYPQFQSLRFLNVSKNRLTSARPLDEFANPCYQLNLLDVTKNDFSVAENWRIRELFAAKHCGVLLFPPDTTDPTTLLTLWNLHHPRSNAVALRNVDSSTEQQSDEQLGNPCKKLFFSFDDIPAGWWRQGQETKKRESYFADWLDNSRETIDLSKMGIHEGYQVTDEEIDQILCGSERLPRPQNLRDCHEILREILRQPKTAVSGFIPKPIQTKFPSTRAIKQKTFWETVRRCGSKLKRNWMRRDALTNKAGTRESNRLGTGSIKRNPQEINRLLKRYNLDKAINGIRQIDGKVFNELLLHRDLLHHHRERIKELEASSAAAAAVALGTKL